MKSQGLAIGALSGVLGSMNKFAAPAIQSRKEAILDREYIPPFGSLPLDKISKTVVDEHTAAKLKRGVSAKTCANHLTVLNTLLGLALDRGLIEKVPTFEWPKIVKSKFDFLNFDEADTFIEAAEEEPFWSTMMLVALKCGLRRGELRALQWDQVDLKRRTLAVDKSCDQEDRIKAPKNGRARTVDLGARVVDALSRHPRRLHCQWVFPSDDLDPLKDNEIKHPLWRRPSGQSSSRCHGVSPTSSSRASRASPAGTSSATRSARTS